MHTRNVMHYDYPLSYLPVGYSFPNCRNHSSRFMPKDTRGCIQGIANLFDIRLTYADDAHLHQNFIGLNFWYRHFFVTELINPSKNLRFHETSCMNSILDFFTTDGVYSVCGWLCKMD